MKQDMTRHFHFVTDKKRVRLIGLTGSYGVINIRESAASAVGVKEPCPDIDPQTQEGCNQYAAFMVPVVTNLLALTKVSIEKERELFGWKWQPAGIVNIVSEIDDLRALLPYGLYNSTHIGAMVAGALEAMDIGTKTARTKALKELRYELTKPRNTLKRKGKGLRSKGLETVREPIVEIKDYDGVMEAHRELYVGLFGTAYEKVKANYEESEIAEMAKDDPFEGFPARDKIDYVIEARTELHKRLTEGGKPVAKWIGKPNPDMIYQNAYSAAALTDDMANEMSDGDDGVDGNAKNLSFGNAYNIACATISRIDRHLVREANK